MRQRSWRPGRGEARGVNAALAKLVSARETIRALPEGSPARRALHVVALAVALLDGEADLAGALDGEWYDTPPTTAAVGAAGRAVAFIAAEFGALARDTYAEREHARAARLDAALAEPDERAALDEAQERLSGVRLR